MERMTMRSKVLLAQGHQQQLQVHRFQPLHRLQPALVGLRPRKASRLRSCGPAATSGHGAR